MSKEIAMGVSRAKKARGCQGPDRLGRVQSNSNIPLVFQIYAGRNLFSTYLGLQMQQTARASST
jgi:hypothetical protein